MSARKWRRWTAKFPPLCRRAGRRKLGVSASASQTCIQDRALPPGCAATGKATGARECAIGRTWGRLEGEQYGVPSRMLPDAAGSSMEFARLAAWWRLSGCAEGACAMPNSQNANADSSLACARPLAVVRGRTTLASAAGRSGALSLAGLSRGFVSNANALQQPQASAEKLPWLAVCRQASRLDQAFGHKFAANSLAVAGQSCK